MNITMYRTIAFVFCMIFNTCLLANSLLAVGGYWKTIDDKTGEAKAIIEITLDQQSRLKGRIVKVTDKPEPGEVKLTHCTLCKGDKKNQPILGMVIMAGLKQTNPNQSHWEGGSILDPKTGKEYHCQLDYDATKNQVKVRGYIGLPLLGRTQVWERIPSPQHSLG
jgi:uncharacterized protein (DUF2147 family)